MHNAHAKASPSRTAPTFTTQIDRATRLRNSASGNPRWRLDTSGGTFLTATDAAPVVIDWTRFVGRAVRLWLDSEGRISQVDPVGLADIIAMTNHSGVIVCSDCDGVGHDHEAGAR